MSTGDHAILAPSFAPVWGHCSGAVIANRDAPETYTPESAEGTAAHWVASEYLTLWQEPGGHTPLIADWDGATAPNGVVIDADILDAVEVYTSHVLALAQEHGALRALRIEHRIRAPQIHPEKNWGTTDCAVWLPDAGLLYVIDYKHGHSYVPARDNLQLINYAAGMIAELGITGHDDQHITAVLQTVHPRCYFSPDGPVSEWRVKLSDLRAPINTLANQAAEAFASPKMTPGAHCRYCPGLLRCRSARLSAYRLIDHAGMPLALDNMPVEHLATEYDALEQGVKVAQARFEAVRDELRHRLQAGEGGSGKTLQSTKGRPKWSVPDAVVLTMGRQFGIDARKPDAITPAQFVKATSPSLRTAAQQAVDGMSSRPTGELKIIDAADSRTARAFKPQEE